MGLPLRDMSLRWYRDFFSDSHWQMASRNSLLVGLATTLLATSLGTLAAIGIRLGGRQARIVLALLCLPIVVPSVIAGLAAATSGLTIRRGVGVSGVLTDTGADGVVHVTGVRTESGEDLMADLVVDSGTFTRLDQAKRQTKDQDGE